MAEQLKREYRLAALKVELVHQRPNVRFTLQLNDSGQLDDLDQWEWDTSDMGFQAQARLERDNYENIQGHLPQNMIDVIAALMANIGVDQPLWVHLVKPYGRLRFVPWERALSSLPCPIVMLPDFIFPRPRESSSVLDVVLCGSAPLTREEWSVQDAMRHASHRILEASARRTRLHIFADKAFSNAFRDEFRNEGRLDIDVFVYDHNTALPYVADDASSRLLDKAGQLRSPWLLWMREALKKRSVDVVHFINHGYLSKNQGAMLFAQSPMERTDRYLAGPVGSLELSTFLTQVGAWGTVFTSVPDDNSEPGLRALADEIAQTRPGPVLMQTVKVDPTLSALPLAYQLLFSRTPSRAPKSPSLFMYCQPYRVAATARADAGGGSIFKSFDPPAAAASMAPPAPAQAPSALEPYFEQDDIVQPWVVATERFAEQVQFRLRQSEQDGFGGDGDESQRESRRATSETLEQLRMAVAQVTGLSGSVSSGNAPQGNERARGESA